MPSSTVEICNLALANLGARSEIQALTEASVEAKECRRWFDPARRSALEEFDWDFARRRLIMSDHTDDPPDTWGYRYQWPADCLAARRIPDPGDDNLRVPFVMENSADGTRSILTNLEEAVLEYTLDVSDPNLFSPTFVIALSYRLAFHMAPKLTAVKGKQQLMWEAYRGAFSNSMASNANQSTANEPAEAPWIKGR